MKQNSYVAVHSHLNVMNGWILLAAKIAGISQRISHSHDAYGKDGALVERLIHKVECALIRCCSHNFLACSELAGNYLYGEKLFKQKGQVINNGIDVEQFLKRGESIIDLGLPSDTSLTIGNISRFEAKKNQMFLLDIFAEILKREPHAVLILGGVDGGQLEQCREKVEQLGISQRVRFIGVREDMPQVLQALDIYAFPSLYEGLGIVLLEAQAAGCYCVASTACPRASDMRLGRIDYIPLTCNSTVWAQRILDGYYTTQSYPTIQEVREAFENMNYSISCLVEKMTKLYIEKQANEEK